LERKEKKKALVVFEIRRKKIEGDEENKENGLAWLNAAQLYFFYFAFK